MNRVLTSKQLQSISKILIIQYKPFGDILLNTAYLPYLRKKFPEAQIDFLIEKPYVTLLEDNPYIDNLIIMSKAKNYKRSLDRMRIMLKLSQSRYDLVIDQLRGTGSAQFVFCCGAKFRLGWQLKKYNWLYNFRRPRTNIRYYALLKFDILEPLGINPVIADTFYKIKESSLTMVDKFLLENEIKAKEYVIVSPGTPVIYKQWSLDNYAKTLDLIQSKYNLKIVMLWGPGEMDDVKYIVDKMERKPVIAPKTSFNEGGAMIKRALFFFGNDGGMNHVSVAVGTPSIAIFGPHTNPKKWQACHKIGHLALRNYSCKDKNDRSLGISPEMALDSINKLLKDIKFR